MFFFCDGVDGGRRDLVRVGVSYFSKFPPDNYIIIENCYIIYTLLKTNLITNIKVNRLPPDFHPANMFNKQVVHFCKVKYVSHVVICKRTHNQDETKRVVDFGNIHRNAYMLVASLEVLV